MKKLKKIVNKQFWQFWLLSLLLSQIRTFFWMVSQSCSKYQHVFQVVTSLEILETSTLTRTVLKSFMHFAWDQNHSENEWKAVINWPPSENMESVPKKKQINIIIKQACTNYFNFFQHQLSLLRMLTLLVTFTYFEIAIFT